MSVRAEEITKHAEAFLAAIGEHADSVQILVHVMDFDRGEDCMIPFDKGSRYARIGMMEHYRRILIGDEDEVE